jgi:hypothetical protein
MKFKNQYILLTIILIATTLRNGFLIRNIYCHPDFFHQDIKAVARDINSGQEPYLNSFGYEASNVAYSIIHQKGFSSPFGGDTGSTGWVAPGIVFLYTLSFYLFGCFTFGSIFFLFVLSILISVVVLYLIYLSSLLIFNNRTVGYISACLFAVCPHDLYLFNIMDVTEFNVFVLFFILNFFLFLQWCRFEDSRHLFLFSVTSALSILFNPVFIGPITVCLVFYVFNFHVNKNIALKQAVSSALIIFILITPYIIYQKNRLGIWSFIKSNGPFELYLGNVHCSNGELSKDIFSQYHPSLNSGEYLVYKDQGEVNYIHSKFNIFLANFNFRRSTILIFNKFLLFYFIYPGSDSSQKGIKLFVRYLTYPIAGISLLFYLLQRLKNKTLFDPLFYAYILSYSLPFMFSGIMWRYSLPIVPLTIILLGMCLYTSINWCIAKFKA